MRNSVVMVLACLAFGAVSVQAEVPAPKVSSEAPPEAVASTESTELAAVCGHCGDGLCVPGCGEDAQNCPQDCWGEPEVACD